MSFYIRKSVKFLTYQIERFQIRYWGIRRRQGRTNFNWPTGNLHSHGQKRNLLSPKNRRLDRGYSSGVTNGFRRKL